MKRGGKTKSRISRKKSPKVKLELVYKEEGQEYAKVLQRLGGPNLRVLCEDGIERMGIIRGSMRNKVWVNVNNYILVSLRDFQDEKCDVLQKYTDEHVRALKTAGEINDNEPDQVPETVPYDFNDI
jgi:translation initiation factor 1A